MDYEVQAIVQSEGLEIDRGCGLLGGCGAGAGMECEREGGKTQGSLYHGWLQIRDT
jgi:hypothetical protein